MKGKGWILIMLLGIFMSGCATPPPPQPPPTQPPSAQEYFNQGMKYFSQGYFDDALRELQRAVDLALALMACAALLWLGLLIGLLLKFDDRRGAILERVPCLGWRGRRFRLLRFRTTVADSRDSCEELRLTPIGDVLRRLDFDRIPQLLNVMAGDLSLVGPRPMTPDFLQAILQEEPLYRHCLTVKPGVTGLAQIHGHRHHLRSKLRYDLSYINNWSLLLDLKILFQSFSVLVTGRKIRA